MSRPSMIRRTLACSALALAACAPATRRGAAVPTSAGGTVRVLLVNDVYVADTLRDGSGGVARVATLRDRLASSGGPVLFVLAGDVLSPSLLSKWYAGRQMVDAFNAARLDYATFGNHEFEIPGDTLIARIAASRFRWVSSNCTMADGRAFPRVAPWDTLTISGVRVGLFGLTLLGDYRSYVRCTDPDSAAHRAVAALRAAGARLVIGLTHQNLDADSALLVREPGIDIILGGHEHEFHKVDVGGRVVVKADANVRTAQLAELARDGERWRTSTQLLHIDRSIAPDSAVARIARAWNDSLVRRLGPDRVVGTATAPIEGRDAVSRYRESALGDLVTDAMRSGLSADVAIINSGTMRIDDVLAAGPMSKYELESIFLFADDTRVIAFPLTGARLRELLEHSVADGFYGHGAFLQVSGISFRYDPSRPSGSRLVGDVVRADGRPLGAADTVRVAFNAYPACEAGDGYVVPEAKPACAESAKGPRAADLLTAHIAGALRGTVTPAPAGRITRAGAP